MTHPTSLPGIAALTATDMGPDNPQADASLWPAFGHG